MDRSSLAVLMCLFVGCAQVPEGQNRAATPAPAPAPAAAPTPAPTAPTPATAGASSPGAEPMMVSGTVTKIDKLMGLLELQTPSGWTQFLITEPERKKELERVRVGDGVDVKVEVRGSERNVVAVLSKKPPVTTQAETK